MTPNQRSVAEIAVECLESGTRLPTYSEIGRRLGISESTVNGIVTRLRASGVLRMDSRRIAEVKVLPVQKTKSENTRIKIMALVKHCDDNGVRWPPRKNICTAIGISAATFEVNFAALIQEGAIYKAGDNCYRIGSGNG